jgi:HTH-type transcriptional regulator/antitoxin MqsA
MPLSPNITCRACRQGTMQEVERTETFHPPGVPEVVVTLLGAQCNHCGKETVLASQMEENLRRRAARKEHYGLYLLGEDIFAFRRKYGLTQQAFSRIFGKGIIAFSRYESEKSFPDESTTKLIRTAMRHPEVLKELADDTGVEVPLWEERCADERARKVAILRPLPMQQVVYAPPVAGEATVAAETFDDFAMPEERVAVAG